MWQYSHECAGDMLQVNHNCVWRAQMKEGSNGPRAIKQAN